MDISHALAPNSDQLDAIELVGGPRVFTITGFSDGPDKVKQPVNVHLEGFPRPWRPNKGSFRIMAECWGGVDENGRVDSSQWIGHRVRLYRDPEVMFGPDKVGGIRISAVSHISEPKRVPVQTKRSKVSHITIDVLAAGPQLITDKQADDFLDTIHKAQDQAALSEVGKQLKAFDLGVYKVELQTAWSARSAELKQPVQGAIDDQEQAS